ncbi:MAG: TonB-dependent receptor [Myxococcota bacterium]
MLDATAAGTEANARDAAAADVSTPELLLSLPGVDVRQTGAAGAGAFVALRGAAPNQTTVLLGDLPLSSPDTGAFDLALLAGTAFDRVEVYRGGAPAWLGSGAIGGVVRFLPPEAVGRRLQARLGMGSFGRWHLGVGSEVGGPRLSVATNLEVDGATNDFPFADDGGTAFDPSDDSEGRRVNAHTRGAFGLVHVQSELPRGGQLDAVVHGASRTGGDPGPAQLTAEATRRTDVRLGGTAAYSHRFAHGRLQLAAGGNVFEQRVSDPLQEIGLERNANRDRFADATFRAAGSADLTPWLELTAVGATRTHRYEPDNQLGIDPPSSTRHTLTGTSELRAHGRAGPARAVHLELRGSARVEHQRTHAAGLRLGRTIREDSNDTRPTIRLAGAVAPRPWISFVGSVATGARFPSFLELFGNQSSIVANVGLGPEQSRAADVGLVVKGRTSGLRGLLEARYFDLRVRDIVLAAPTSQQTVRFENSEDARSRGLELGGQATWGTHIVLRGAMTYLRTRGERGVELNWRPRLQSHAHAEVHSRALGRRVHDLVAFTTVLHRGAYFNDRANLVRIAGRTWLALGCRVDLALSGDGSRLSLLATARDVLDRRGQDFLGFPLPGRRYAGELRYRWDW